MVEKGTKRNIKKSTTTKEKEEPTIVTLQGEELKNENQEISNTEVNSILEFSEPIELIKDNVINQKEEPNSKKIEENITNVVESPKISETKNILYTNRYFGRYYD